MTRRHLYARNEPPITIKIPKSSDWAIEDKSQDSAGDKDLFGFIGWRGVWGYAN